MPTYDYECDNCGHKAEYLNVPVDSNPACELCGNPERMKRLPTVSRVSTGSTNLRTQKISQIEIGFGFIEHKDHVHPTISIERKVIDTEQGFN